MGFSELNNAGAIEARLWQRYGKLARSQGRASEIYRPIDSNSPFGNMIGILPVVYTNNYGFIKPYKFGTSALFGIFDATNVQEGDYLVVSDDSSAYYVASLGINAPIVLVKCERTVTVSKINGPSGAKGVVGYSGAKTTEETILLKDWKASILQGTKGENNQANLPLDVRMPWWTILMPFFQGVVINTGDVIRCDLGRKYVVSSAELTNMGWRITAVIERV